MNLNALRELEHARTMNGTCPGPTTPSFHLWTARHSIADMRQIERKNLIATRSILTALIMVAMSSGAVAQEKPAGEPTQGGRGSSEVSGREETLSDIVQLTSGVQR